MPYALLSCSFVTLLYCYCFLNEISGDGDRCHVFNFQLHYVKSLTGYVHLITWAWPSVCRLSVTFVQHNLIGAVSGNEIIKINMLLHAFPVVTAKESNSNSNKHISIAPYASYRGAGE